MTTDRSLIGPDEMPLWSGKPNPIRYALGESFGAFLVGAFFFATALIWFDVTASAGNYLWLGVIPLLAISVAPLASPFWHFYRARCTTYLLTDKRVIIAVAGIRPRRLNVLLSEIGAIDARRYSDDAGAIIFKEVITRDPETGGEIIEHEGFIAIPDLTGVVRILRQAIDRLSEDRAPRKAS
jgi:hypothetical protein